MDISYIQVFLTVAEEMNFSRAAKKLFMTQQAVSNTIQKMENEYGIQLFERKPVLKLTAAGQEMKEYGANVIENYNSMCRALADANRSYTSKIRLGMSTLCNEVFFKDIWKEFHRKCPDVCLESISARSGRMQKMIRGGELSVCVALNLKPDENMVVKELVREHPCCGISLTLLQKYHPEITAADMRRMEREGISEELLKDIPCFSQSEEEHGTNPGQGTFRTLYRSIIGLASQSTVLYKMARTGAGYSILFPITHYKFREEVNQPDGDFWILPFAFDTVELCFCIAYSKEYKLSPAEEDLIHIIENTWGDFREFLRQQGYIKS